MPKKIELDFTTRKEMYFITGIYLLMAQSEEEAPLAIGSHFKTIMAEFDKFAMQAHEILNKNAEYINLYNYLKQLILLYKNRNSENYSTMNQKIRRFACKVNANIKEAQLIELTKPNVEGPYNDAIARILYLFPNIPNRKTKINQIIKNIKKIKNKKSLLKIYFEDKKLAILILFTTLGNFTLTETDAIANSIVNIRKSKK